MGVPAAPRLEGELPGEALGTSVAGCRFEGFVAGGAGGSVLELVFPNGDVRRLTTPFPNDPGPVRSAVACEGDEARWTAASASEGGFYAFHWDGGQPLILSAGPSLARSASRRSHPLALGRPLLGEVELIAFDPDAGVFQSMFGQTLRLDAGAGDAVAWSRDGSMLAVANWSQGVVLLVDPVARVPLTGGRFEGPTNKGFGSSLAFGDVHPAVGEELLVAVAGTREVIVLGKVNGQLVEVQRVGPLGSVPGAPRPLVVEPTSFLARGSLQAYWVGAPEADAIYRFVGDAGVKFEAAQAMDFGASLGIMGQSLLVGAPGFDTLQSPDAGAVFVLPLNTEVLPTAEAMVCKVGLVCVTSTCVPGRCLGGVACEPTTNVALCSPDVCRSGVCTLPDAGFPDAGAVDAGERDAGEPDAGPVDGGEPDAGQGDGGATDGGESDAGSTDGGPGGPVTFTACGCSSGGLASTSLLAVLLVMLLRRSQRS
jgi:hypothetical protein